MKTLVNVCVCGLGFSDLMVEVSSEATGKHARSAVGMAGLPFNNAVEVEMIVEVE